ncbi:helix-turn-helix transcriptional regulator [Frankia sp. CNm7]|uniref:Helix-turn-helix transcriptional regulator n=1 Tax=Frankia nepalensis TaxID=1836974 RepID=A0A937RIM4_9ACTN|nr:helix-turn-helix transcriptional regulator [Frankia nepalensis]MBL7514092.1 helix-turn-helix transcriptional regulator [Frankia nepalensis]MBL7522870.1 helix-turn-helix transcriptional regulator [Frankia nepalensis]MBL7632943.1 helix-turn-helix transcriptional regulator [Frankia nepalensis]
MTKDGERHLHAVREDWPAVAAALNERMTARRLSQAELALAAGVSVATLRVLQRGNGARRVQNSTLFAVSRALGWAEDHLVRVLLGARHPEPGGASAPAGAAGSGPSPTAADADADLAAKRPPGEDAARRTPADTRTRRPSRGQPDSRAQPDLPAQILSTLRRIERHVDDIARHVVRA